MPKGINKVFLIGHIGKDPEVTYTGGGLCIAKFSLATTESVKKGDSYEDKTEWHRIVFFGKQAENYIAKYIHKGDAVYVEGKIAYGSYEVEGVKRYTTDIIGQQIQSMGGKSDDAPKKKAPQDSLDRHLDGDDSSDMPF